MDLQTIESILMDREGYIESESYVANIRRTFRKRRRQRAYLRQFGEAELGTTYTGNRVLDKRGNGSHTNVSSSTCSSSLLPNGSNVRQTTEDQHKEIEPREKAVSESLSKREILTPFPFLKAAGIFAMNAQTFRDSIELMIKNAVVFNPPHTKGKLYEK